MKLSEADQRFYPSLFIAVFIAAGYMDGFPLEWTRDGARAVRRHHQSRRHYSGIGVFDEAWAKVGHQFTKVVP